MIISILNTFYRFKPLKLELAPLFLVVSLLLVNGSILAQEKPPKPITVVVNTLQHLNFGTFIQTGASGTVSMNFSGAVTPGGSVIIPSLGFNPHAIPTPALFEVTANSGTVITIQNGPPATLTGSNGGTLSLTIGASSIGSPFVTQNAITYVYVGGTLTVGSMAANPAGNYTGTFTVTFIQQ
ncbi:MAG: DUF4402 domain-containing protein [Bacteroidia bacterium]|nr:DUF4402 domain-containing protein [Bacteroidia bacterium]